MKQFPLLFNPYPYMHCGCSRLKPELKHYPNYIQFQMRLHKSKGYGGGLQFSSILSTNAT